MMRLWVLVGFTALTVLVASAFWFATHQNHPSAPSQVVTGPLTTTDVVGDIASTCAGGRTAALNSQVRVGLDKLLTGAQAETVVKSQDIGAVLDGIKPDDTGKGFYKEYVDCVRDQTILKLEEKGITVQQQEDPKAKAEAVEQQRRDDVATISFYGNYGTEASLQFPGKTTDDSVSWISMEPPKVVLGPDKVAVSYHLDEKYPDGGGNPRHTLDVSFEAPMTDLLERSTMAWTESEPPGGFLEPVQCATAACVSVHVVEKKDGSQVSEKEYSQNYFMLYFIHQPVSNGSVLKQEITVERALERLLSPTHTDKLLCEQLALKGPPDLQCKA